VDVNSNRTLRQIFYSCIIILSLRATLNRCTGKAIINAIFMCVINIIFNVFKLLFRSFPYKILRKYGIFIDLYKMKNVTYILTQIFDTAIIWWLLNMSRMNNNNDRYYYLFLFFFRHLRWFEFIFVTWFRFENNS